MRPITIIASVLVVATLALIGCGGDGDSGTSAEEESITVLVGELNRVTADSDAAGFCDLMQPSGVKTNFKSRSRCVNETSLILKQAGPQPVLNIEDISVDGETATVKLEGSVGELNLAKEGGEWYVAFSSTGPESAETGGSGSSDAEGAAGPPAGDSGSDGG